MDFIDFIRERKSEGEGRQGHEDSGFDMHYRGYGITG
jgi:hypothetical protein